MICSPNISIDEIVDFPTTTTSVLSQASWGRLDMKPNRNIWKPKGERKKK